MEVIGIIPVRYESSRFPGKPLVRIHGKTLLERTYCQAKKCRTINKIIIATDDQRIFEHAQSFGAEVVMTSTSCLNGTERMVEAIKNNPKLSDAEIYVNIQGDEPCIEPTTIDTLVSELKRSPEANMATVVTKLSDQEKILSSSVCKCVFNAHGYALYFSRSPIPFSKNTAITYKHIGLYAFRKDFLLLYGKLPNTPLQLAEDLEQLKVLENGYKIKVAVVDSDALEVNVPEDIQMVEEFLCKTAQI